MRWRDNPNAVELGFDYYMELLELRLKGEDVSLVQGLRHFYQEKLGIDLRETQARGLMHRSSSVFIDYVRSILGSDFRPNSEHWEERGLERFLEWRNDFYRARNLEAVDINVGEKVQGELVTKPEQTTEPPQRREVTVSRIIRDSALSRFLKSLYDYQCQICRFTFTLSNRRRYAESHHIRPLGRPHTGIDKETNMVILCPNHHAMMDLGAIAIDPDGLTIVSVDRAIAENQRPLQLSRHPIDRQFLEYHMEIIFGKV
jgi:5-methylcytosine-specific restriction endonuclease McrA